MTAIKRCMKRNVKFFAICNFKILRSHHLLAANNHNIWSTHIYKIIN